MQLSQPYTGERIARFQIDRVSVKVQVDHVDLRKDGAVVAHSGMANSQSQGTPGHAEAQLAGGHTWSAGCTSSYRVVLYYSVRMTSGRLVTGNLATQTFKAPGC
jgi:hypothetical protein